MLKAVMRLLALTGAVLVAFLALLWLAQRRIMSLFRPAMSRRPRRLVSRGRRP